MDAAHGAHERLGAVEAHLHVVAGQADQATVPPVAPASPTATPEGAPQTPAPTPTTNPNLSGPAPSKPGAAQPAPAAGKSEEKERELTPSEKALVAAWKIHDRLQDRDSDATWTAASRFPLEFRRLQHELIRLEFLSRSTAVAEAGTLGPSETNPLGGPQRWVKSLDVV